MTQSSMFPGAVPEKSTGSFVDRLEANTSNDNAFVRRMIARSRARDNGDPDRLASGVPKEDICYPNSKYVFVAARSGSMTLWTVSFDQPYKPVANIKVDASMAGKYFCSACSKAFDDSDAFDAHTLGWTDKIKEEK